jgi:hypothetical protein
MVTFAVTDLSNAEQARALIERFGGFFDAVIIDVRLALLRESAHRSGSVRLMARAVSADAGSADGWSYVVLTIGGLRGYRFAEGPASYLVLSDGLGIYWTEEGQVVVDLCPTGTTPSGKEPSSDQYMSGSRCSYSVEGIDA